MFSCFQSSYTKEKLSTQDSQLWWDMLTQIDEIKPDETAFVKPKKGIIEMFYRMVTSKIFETAILFIIILNLITLILNYQGAPELYISITSYIEIFCNLIFILECILKLAIYGFKSYFKEAWNKFDFFVAATGCTDIVFSFYRINIFGLVGLFKLLVILRIFIF